jgi:hypothetical protein
MTATDSARLVHVVCAEPVLDVLGYAGDLFLLICQGTEPKPSQSQAKSPSQLPDAVVNILCITQVHVNCICTVHAFPYTASGP